MPGLPKLIVVGLSCVVVSACVSDPTVENDVPARSGAHQPGVTPGSVLSAKDACDQVLSAEKSARDQLSCAARTPAPVCPSYLAVAGAMPCDSYEETTVTACVAAIGKYTSCDDFDTKPCIVTAIACHAPAGVPEAGTHNPDAGQLDAAGPDATAPETTPDSSVVVDGGASLDAGVTPDATTVTDSGPEKG
jgi:hypothetical protein